MNQSIDVVFIIFTKIKEKQKHLKQFKKVIFLLKYLQQSKTIKNKCICQFYFEK